jgi:hypothetical protein
LSARDDKILIYRRTFCTPWGMETLADILEELGFFQRTEVNDAEGVALVNQARRMLVNCGLDFQTPADRQRFVEAILGVEPTLDDPISTPKEGKLNG